MTQLIETLIGRSDQGAGIIELDLSGNPLDSKGTQMLCNRIIKDFKDLRVLKLARCNCDIPRLIHTLNEAQQNSKLELEELDLSGNKMTQKDGLLLSGFLAKFSYFMFDFILFFFVVLLTVNTLKSKKIQTNIPKQKKTKLAKILSCF